MSGKDPNDMTAAKLLRYAAEDIRENICGSESAINILSEVVGSKETYNYGDDLANALEVVADKIDAEIEAARDESFLSHVDSLISLCGYPIRRKGEEVFDEWIDRCFIPRHRYEDGETVQFGDRDIDWDDTDECRAPGVQWVATAVDCNGRLLATAYDKIVAVAKTDEYGRVKRRVPEVPGADGLPIEEGETVWDTESGKELSVCAIANADAGMIQCSDDDGYCEDYDARHLTHTPPDTQQRIDADALKSTASYWDCLGRSCVDCPAEIDDKRPWERCGASSCEQAQLLDLLRRQRELDARKGGE